uniref:Formylglycine-generating enzyme, required for sulfatase activity, contains SUMF1/FGE domain n=1 Tax=Candidatus Kentrum sp. TUN TaxID=2126343 RepID=A0A450ZKN4_9GAMM|nr:MAG: Formylglycine-generating enzyme, required for sulfatase activity, contains SUMF1/FGE domain [Candidatus Kentron sp. TUN]
MPERFFRRVPGGLAKAPALRSLRAAALRGKADTGQGPVRVLTITLHGEDLIFSQESSPPGSPIGRMESRDGVIDWEAETGHVDRNAFWESGAPPAWAADWGQDRYGPWVEFVIRDVRQRMRWCPPGKFRMGSPADEPGRFDDEGPQHEVTLREGFWLFDTPVTQGLWRAVMGQNPSRFQGVNRPVEQVSWANCQAFITRINERVSGLMLGLPSEAQWEYACRAGTITPLYNGPIEIEDHKAALDPIAWYDANSNGRTHPVARKEPNPWGFFDMLGNVWEWTQDHWYVDYRGAPADGTAWEGLDSEAGADRVYRGGSWGSDASVVRAAVRNRNRPDIPGISLGFRCARVHVSQADKQSGEDVDPARPSEAVSTAPK